MKTQCPNCKSKFSVNETNIGKQAKCPKCAKLFTIEPFIETPVAVEAPAKSPEPAAPSVQSPKSVETPIKKLTAEHAETAEKKPKAISANFAVSAVKSVSKTALSKAVFVYCWAAVRIIAGVLGALGLMLAIRKGTHSTLIATFAAADVFLVCSVAIELALYYKMWAAIQDSEASTSPAKAIGFLFIPVFNIYWALLMLTGFAEDYNAFIQRRSVKTKDLPMSLFLIYAFAFILSATVVTIPMICVFKFVGLINRAFIGYPVASWLLFSFIFAAGIGQFITYILVAIKTCDAINALPERQGGKQTKGAGA
jgi:predicted Zn finger-like uncharacterized protein